MQEIIKSINEAENKAAEIKEQALQRAAAIAEAAEVRCAEIEKLCEAECKAYRENAVRQAQIDAQNKYDEEITVKRAEAAQYAADKLKNTDKIVNDIVRRITRGSC